MGEDAIELLTRQELKGWVDLDFAGCSSHSPPFVSISARMASGSASLRMAAAMRALWANSMLGYECAGMALTSAIASSSAFALASSSSRRRDAISVADSLATRQRQAMSCMASVRTFGLSSNRTQRP